MFQNFLKVALQTLLLNVEEKERRFREWLLGLYVVTEVGNREGWSLGGGRIEMIWTGSHQECRCGLTEFASLGGLRHTQGDMARKQQDGSLEWK